MKKLLVMMLVVVTVVGSLGVAVPSAYAKNNKEHKNKGWNPQQASLDYVYGNNANKYLQGGKANKFIHGKGHGVQNQLDEYIRHLQALIAELEARQGNNYGNNNSNGNSEVRVVTRSAEDRDDDSATIVGEVDLRDSDEATIYFNWGTSASNLSYETSNITVDDIQNEEEFTAVLTNLAENTTYYFQAVAEDEDGRQARGAVLSFRTTDDGNDDDDNDNYPDVDTEQVDSVNDSSARLSGTVDMNDYDNGQVFFVYGDDEDMVDDIASDYDTYGDIDESGDSLQKVSVASSLDDAASYTLTVSGLNDDTDMYYALCVAFEDEDNDDVIVCGDTDNFTTDEN